MKHINIKSSEVLHGGKTLDKEIKDINDKIGNISPDGSIIATKEKLGNVIIGNNIDANQKGVISVPVVSSDKKNYGVVKYGPKINNWNDYISVGIDTDGKLGVKKATNNIFGVVSPDNKDFTCNNGYLKLKYEQSFIYLNDGGLDCIFYSNKAIIRQDYISESSIQRWSLDYMNNINHKNFICKLLKLLLQGNTITYIAEIRAADDNTAVECVVADLKFEFRYKNDDVYSSVVDVINDINVNTLYDILLYSRFRIYIDCRYNSSNKTITLFDV